MHNTLATANSSEGGTHALQQLIPSMTRELVGLEDLVERLLMALLTGGHVLIEGPPGVAKTRTIRELSKRLTLDFARIQATPDLLPSDITGSDVFHQPSGEFRFVPGPLFNQMILVDEINRAPPKVQSALLEAMGEQQVSHGGVTRLLQQPFLVAATQNPIEHEGTYPLPEAQLDRFMFFVELTLPDPEQERRILDQVLTEQSGGESEPVKQNTGNTHAQHNVQVESKSHHTQSSTCIRAQDVFDARHAVQQVHVSDAVRDYIVRLTAATRGYGRGAVGENDLAHAASPRASINLALAARARAWLNQRDYVSPDDVAALVPDIFCGRVALDYRARAAGRTARDIVTEILEKTPRL